MSGKPNTRRGMGKGVKGRAYSDREKAEALAYLDANIIPKLGRPNWSQAATALGIPRRTLSDWYTGAHGVNGEVVVARQENREDIASKFRDLRDSCLNAIAPYKLQMADAKSLVTMAAILTDKIQLLDGNPTSIHGHVLTEGERVSEIARLLDRARARSTGLPVGVRATA